MIKGKIAVYGVKTMEKVLDCWYDLRDKNQSMTLYKGWI